MWSWKEFVCSFIGLDLALSMISFIDIDKAATHPKPVLPNTTDNSESKVNQQNSLQNPQVGQPCHLLSKVDWFYN